MILITVTTYIPSISASDATETSGASRASWAACVERTCIRVATASINCIVTASINYITRAYTTSFYGNASRLKGNP